MIKMLNLPRKHELTNCSIDVLMIIDLAACTLHSFLHQY